MPMELWKAKKYASKCKYFKYEASPGNLFESTSPSGRLLVLSMTRLSNQSGWSRRTWMPAKKPQLWPTNVTFSETWILGKIWSILFLVDFVKHSQCISNSVHFYDIWLNKVTFVQVWSHLVNFDHIWSILITFGLFWSHLVYFDHIWSILIIIWSILITFGQFWSHLVNFDHIWSILITFGQFWSSFGLFWSHLVNFDHIWSILIIFGQFWSHLVNFDPIWSILTTFGLCSNQFKLGHFLSVLVKICSNFNSGQIMFTKTEWNHLGFIHFHPG